MTAKKSPRAQAPKRQAAIRKPRAPALDLQSAVRAAVREAMYEPPRGGLAMDTEPVQASGPYREQPTASPVTPVEIALDENTAALGRLHDALSVLGDRLERTVLPPAPPQSTGDTASPSFGASPVLHRLTSLHVGIEGAASRVHSILARLEA